MRKLAVFALLGYAAMSVGLVSSTLANQAQTSGQQSAARPSQQTGNRPSQQNAQAMPPSAQTGKSSNQAQAARPAAIPPGFRLLSLKEGRAIAQGIAWADDEEGLAPDCSHLVHTLYQRAGYPYPYATSVDLFLGTGIFLRVRTAQPGDLMVWRGHVGIVMSPRNHSFFSSVTAGTQIQDYRSTYWQARGYPRFYRYLTKSPLK